MTTTVPDEVLRFISSAPVGVLATRRQDGSVRQSVVYHVLDEGRVLISTESKRAKARDVERDGWASYCVCGHAKPWPSVTVEGRARILRENIGAISAEVFAKIGGQPVGEPISEETLIEMDRVVIEIAIERVYGAAYLEDGA